MPWRTLNEAREEVGALVERGALDDALRACEWICEHDPADWNAWQMRSAIHGMRGEFAACADCARQVIAINPGFHGAHSNLGGALHQLGRHGEALECFKEALRLVPSDPETRSNLGYVLFRLGDFGGAERCFADIVEQTPDFAPAHNGLGAVCVTRREFEKALAHFDRAIALKSDLVDARVNRAKTLNALGRRDEAGAAASEVLRFDPNHPEACLAYGDVLRHRDQLEDALSLFQRGLARNPQDAALHCGVGLCLCAQGRVSEAIVAYRRALEVDPSADNVHSNLLLTLNYSDQVQPEEVFAEHQRWAARFPPPERRAAPPPARARADKLRIGYVSGDLRTHSVAYFVEPLLTHFDRDRFEVIGYYTGEIASQDATTQRLRDLATAWRILGGTDQEAAELVRNDAIDILVDLSGHTAHSRLGVFALRPAPVQITYLGYPNTTGLAAMDYRLTDAVADPPGLVDRLHSEQLLRLPGGFLCYRPSRAAPAVTEPPAERTGFVTFGSFNNLAKMSPTTVAAWANILHAVPNARLVVKNYSLRDGVARQLLRHALLAGGAREAQLELLPASQSTEAHLAAYAKIDIGLDTFPYNGTTTTCEALWMGVPVITLVGRVHAARVGASLLAQTGLDEFAAPSVAEYCRIAAALAADAQKRRSLRLHMRQRLTNSRLLDGPGFCRRVEAAFDTVAGRKPRA